MTLARLCFCLALIGLMASEGLCSAGFVRHADGTVTAPDGLIWHARVERPNGLFKNAFTYQEAVTCCNAGPRVPGYPDQCPFGADGTYLPTAQEYTTLGKQLGYGTPDGYDPEPIPELANSWYWSSRGPGGPIYHYVFMSNQGYTGNWDPMQSFAVRCVSR